jgi:phage shock protein PspC (stress-responsive transcriptional regulator)
MGLYRSSDDRVLAGVCGGLADKMGLNSTGFRIIFFIVAFFFAAWTLGIIFYVLCWLLLPERPTRPGASPPTA